jgi:phage terminase Nu1 subunit (DNA packaging protein)
MIMPLEQNLTDSPELRAAPVRTSRSLGARLGVVERTVTRWLRAGCPGKRADGTFDVDAVKAWARERRLLPGFRFAESKAAETILSELLDDTQRLVSRARAQLAKAFQKDDGDGAEPKGA